MAEATCTTALANANSLCHMPMPEPVLCVAMTLCLGTLAIAVVNIAKAS